MNGPDLDPLAALTQGGPCPSWCEQADSGHPYRFGLLDDDRGPATYYHRLHHRRVSWLAEGRATLHLHQLETTADPASASELAPASVVLDLGIESAIALAPDALGGFVAELGDAVHQLAQADDWWSQ